ncbi:thiamine ABC transporter substrate-binding protein [Halorussus salilacus]|uniref:thiamine ABC transporter substrate-binding protein n=1 Tax=Halorussus salilacus TaxID=2953750 RepID=UPI00209EC585|nr:thiamine ABC transporter substrate-binding protein [Halorussus salilacus]USZ67053.1 thiamine ABC transporter substrate-binding protein [Halorussus salilacus]
MDRRTFLKSGAAGGLLGLAGCLGSDDAGQQDTTEETAETATTEETTTEGTETTAEETDEETTEADEGLSGTLTVATYGSFVDAPSSAPGPWLKETFEERHPDVTVEWATPDNEMNYYIQRAQQGVDIDADLYVGINVDHLIRIDEQLGDGGLFASSVDALEHYDHVEDDLKFDPQQRAVPYDTGYISLVYDGTEVEDPETFDALTTDEYAGDLIVQNAQSAATGRAFLLWTIHNRGEENYLDYWEQLVDNDVRILGSWDDAYTAWDEGEAPMVVSYSTDQVYANREGADLDEHQVSFLDGQGYANPEGMARFADAPNPELAEAFMDFVLSAEAQGEIAMRNVQFPATDWAELSEEFEEYAKVPDDPVTFTYEELQGNVDEWVDTWARQIAGK